jgi:hypothetical protein
MAFDDNVIDMKDRFKPKSEKVFECPCGCQWWYLTEQNFVRCVRCSTISHQFCVGEVDTSASGMFPQDED